MPKNKPKTVASSPDRHTFMTSTESGKNNPALKEFYEKVKEEDAAKVNLPEWQINNMEYDLRSTAWIVDKVKANTIYAQNLYAAMCNMQFLKLEVMPILKDDRWSASWRHAGGIIADMREEGDYIDWYCSGSGISCENDKAHEGFVSEGVVTDEIKIDLQKLGWVPVPWDEDD